MITWKRETVHEIDFDYSVYTCEINSKRAEIRCLDGGTGSKKYGADLLLEKKISKKKWETIVDREWFQIFTQARKVAETWLTE